MLIHSGAELESYSRSEEDRLETLISGIAASGAQVTACSAPAPAWHGAMPPDLASRACRDCLSTVLMPPAGMLPWPDKT